MSMRSFRRIWYAFALLLALPQLAAAQHYWEVRDGFTGQVVFPSGTISLFEDIVSPTIAQRRYQIANVSNFPDLSLGPCSIVVDGPSFVISVYPYLAGQQSTTVDPGYPVSMAVQHHPYAPPGTKDATIRCSSAVGTIEFRVRGRVLDPVPYIILETLEEKEVAKGSTFDFGSTQAGTPIDRNFRIINMGNQTLTVNLSVTGAGYSVKTAPPQNIIKGTSATFSLRLLSSAPGAFNGELFIGNNDPNDNPYRVNLTGSVLTPQIRVTDNGNFGAVVAKGSTVNIGTIPPNVPLDRTFTITNTGNATLSLTNPTSFLSGAGYSILTYPASSLTAGSNTIFTVRLQAATVASYLGTVNLSNNDSNNNPFSFNLSATVAPAPAPRIRIVNETTGQAIAPGNTVSLGNTMPNTAVVHNFRIHNDGTGSLTLANRTSFVAGSGFTLSTFPASPVAPGGSTPFSIRFQAGASGTYNGAADLQHNDTTVPRPFHFGLQATVLPPTPVVTLTASDPDASETSPNGGGFTLTRTGSTAMPLTVNLSHSGTAVNGTDYASIATTQTFAAGQSVLNLPVSPVDDTAIEDVETVTLTLAAGAGYTAGSPSNGTVSVTNNDYTACTPNASRLCLNAGRFEATLTAVAGSASYTGQAFSLGDSSGAFWLFSPDNIEVSVKVLDGSFVNGRFWVFYGTATSLPYTLTVKDRANASQVRTFIKPDGSLCGGADVNAFLKVGTQRPETALDFDSEVPETYLKAFTCAPNATTTCLLGNRFQVRIRRGTAYQGVVPVTSQTAFFWFFSPDNTEIFVKVLDGTGFNGKYWVFFGSITDQSYTIEVTDSVTGILKSYTSPGPMCGNADINAF
jgi:hypothetical protein